MTFVLRQWWIDAGAGARAGARTMDRITTMAGRAPTPTPAPAHRRFVLRLWRIDADTAGARGRWTQRLAPTPTPTPSTSPTPAPRSITSPVDAGARERGERATPSVGIAAERHAQASASARRKRRPAFHRAERTPRRKRRRAPRRKRRRAFHPSRASRRRRKRRRAPQSVGERFTEPITPTPQASASARRKRRQRFTEPSVTPTPQASASATRRLNRRRTPTTDRVWFQSPSVVRRRPCRRRPSPPPVTATSTVATAADAGGGPTPLSAFTPTPNASTQVGRRAARDDGSYDDSAAASVERQARPHGRATHRPAPATSSDAYPSDAYPSGSTTPPPPGVPPPPASPPHPPPASPSRPSPPTRRRRRRRRARSVPQRTLSAEQTVKMFLDAEDHRRTLTVNQTLHLTFGKWRISRATAAIRPGVKCASAMARDASVFVANGHHVQIIIRAAEAPGARRAVYVRYGAVQRVLEARNPAPTLPPPPPVGARPAPSNIVLGHVAANHPRICVRRGV